MSTVRRWSMLLAAVALVAAGCGGDGDEEVAGESTAGESSASEGTEEPAESEASEPEESASDASEAEESASEAAPSEEGSEAAVERADADLVIWADDTRAPVLEPFAERFGEEQGVTVAVQEVPFDDIRDLTSQRASAGQGPDVFIGAHDWLGQLVADGVVAQIDLAGTEGEYQEVAVEAATYEGETYMLPYAVENIALFRNTDLVPEAPATYEEMVATAQELSDADEVSVPFGWQQPDVYHNYWLVTGAGGGVFGRTDSGGYTADEVLIDSEGSLEAAELFADLAEQDLVSQNVTYDVMIESFNSGDAPFAVTGPWALESFTDVSYEVSPFPTVEGGTPAPFVGVQGFMVSAFAQNELAAQTFVRDFMGTADAQMRLFEAGGRPPALTEVFEEVSSDPTIQAFGEAGAAGAPLPAIPAMNSVWEAWTQAYELILQGEPGPSAFESAAQQVRTLIEES